MRSKRLISVDSTSFYLPPPPRDAAKAIKKESRDVEECRPETMMVSTFGGNKTQGDPYLDFPISTHMVEAISMVTPSSGDPSVPDPKVLPDSSHRASKRLAVEETEVGVRLEQNQLKVGPPPMHQIDDVKFLRCFQEYLKRKGMSPEEFSRNRGRIRHSDAFHVFVKETLGVGGNWLVKEKMSNLRIRYRKMMKAKEEGKTLVFKTPRKEEVFLLSMNIWGGENDKGADHGNRSENEVHPQEFVGVHKGHLDGRGGGSSSGMATESLETMCKKMHKTATPAGEDEDCGEISKKSVKTKDLKSRSLTEILGSVCPTLNLGELSDKSLQMGKRSKLRRLEERQSELEIAILRIQLERQKLNVKRTKLALKSLIKTSSL